MKSITRARCCIHTATGTKHATRAIQNHHAPPPASPERVESEAATLGVVRGAMSLAMTTPPQMVPMKAARTPTAVSSSTSSA
eukprot:3924642-Prymnesium_polylepis.1